MPWHLLVIYCKIRDGRFNTSCRHACTLSHKFFNILSLYVLPGNTKGGSINVPLTSCLTGMESGVSLLTIIVTIYKTD